MTSQFLPGLRSPLSLLLALGCLAAGLASGCSGTPDPRPGETADATPPLDQGPAPDDGGAPDLADGGVGPDGCRPLAEACNALDDDCDGLTDEDFLLARDALNCGRCGNRCRYVNGAGACVDSACVLDRCVPGYVDADHRPETGCEARCLPTNGGIEICDTLDNDCNGEVDDGYDLQGDTAHCGRCGRQCLLRHAEPGCSAGECVIARCEVGWFDEDDDPLTGCEATCHQTNEGVERCDRVDNDCDGVTDEDFDLQTSLEHCGVCDHGCSFPNAVPRCLIGECVIDSCAEGWSDQGDPADGCETPCVVSNGALELCDLKDNDCDGRTDDGYDLELDPDNCGACGRQCQVANGEGGCAAGDCRVARCEAGFIDADGRYDNGCETPCVLDDEPFEVCDGRDNDCNGEVDELWDLQADPFHCGGCDTVCAFANAVPGCLGGNCQITACETGYADIDHRRDNGCEALCSPSNEGVERCDGVDNDCNGVIDDGYDLHGDPDHCGVCDRVCPAVAHGERACLGGECGIGGCASGWADADRQADSGCEYACSPSNEGVERCDEVDNDCDGTVDEGFDKLHGLDHCGGCFADCHPPHAVPVCDAGQCRIAQCEDGWHDAANGIGDGCELPCRVTQGGLESCDELDNDCNGVVDDGFAKQTDPAHCGRCDNSCLQPHRDNRCVAGQCQMGGCVDGWVDQNGQAIDGCEYACTLNGAELCNGRDDDCDRATDEGFDLASSIEHCGQCNRRCSYAHAAARCDQGLCRRGDCDPGWYDANRNPLDGCEYACTVSNGGIEICDRLDNDCNGVVDDGWNLDSDLRNCGACGRRCELAGATSICSGGSCAIQSCTAGLRDANQVAADGCECTLTHGGVERCDGLDNDCNGVVDDGLGVPPVSCLRFGVCAGVAPRCDGAGGWSCPYPDSYEAVEGRCDGLDNDCNGLVDEPYPTLETPCGGGTGVCRGAGTVVCNLAQDDVECTDEPHPERAAAERCDNLDNDCDGGTDEDSDDWVQLGELLIYRYEASHPDATAGAVGSSFARACSAPGRLPWTDVDWPTARQACARAGGYLCEAEAWQGVCGGGDWAYPYHPTQYQPLSCNGYDKHVGHPLPTGALGDCTTPAGVLDLSGNVWEWVDTDLSPAQDGSIRAFIGGGYGNQAEGLTCRFDVAADPATARDNIGFRCCSDTACRGVDCGEGHFCKSGQCFAL